MKKILKTIIACLFILQAINISAQQLNTSQMNNSGQSSEDTKARYILGLVRNNNIEALEKHFSQFPWDIQAKIDVYKNSDKKASVSIFCVAVDLGLIDVVKTFVKYGYGPADLCDVRTFTKVKQENISRAEIFLTKSQVADWIPVDPHTGNKADIIFTGHDEIKGTYNQVAYSTVTSVKAYFAYPLDFAGGEMFNYLFAQGFRSDKLLTQKALKEAQRLGRIDIINYILANMPKEEFAPIVDDETFAQMVADAKANPGSLAYFALVNGTLRYKTSAKVKAAKIELENQLKNMEITQPSDTAGYASMHKALQTTEAKLRKQEEYQAQLKKIRDEDWNKFSINGSYHTELKNVFYSTCPMGIKEKRIRCYYKLNTKEPACTVGPWPKYYECSGYINYHPADTADTIHCKE